MHAYGNAAALLAVHSAISFTDAVRMHLLGERGDGEDHAETIGALQRICRSRRLSEEVPEAPAPLARGEDAYCLRRRAHGAIEDCSRLSPTPNVLRPGLP